MTDWNNYMSIMTSGTESEKKNWNCWMKRYLSGCLRCDPCPDKDPFNN
jgi:hypothetical protein